MSEQSKLHEVFKSGGALAQAIQGFSERSQQLEMALAIESAIQQNKQLVAEAGTGTGKTFAYLVPALLSGGKVIISTGTKTLQDQLFNRDLPNIRDALKVPVTVSVKLMNADAKACIQVGVKRGSTAEFDSQTITNICNAPVYVHWCHAPSSRSGTASSVCGYKGGALYFGHSTVLAPGASNDNFYTMPVDATLFYGACSGAFMTQLGDGKYACNKP